MFKQIFVVFFIIVVILGFSIGIFWTLLLQPPHNFPVNEIIVVEPGGLRTVAETLQEANVIRSAWAFILLSRITFEQTPVQAGSYLFANAITANEVMEQLQSGENGAKVYRLVFPEGRTVSHLAERLHDLLPDFDQATFLELALPLEGMLFPETYFIAPDATPDSIVELLKNTFTQRVTNGRSEEIANHHLSEYEIITLASIIEREANTPESKQMVAGILQNRLTINMPLQADASIEYVLDKPLSELTSTDLEIDSPYNTYLNRGLPPTPINNPGLAAIDAVLQPADTEYLFYITAPDGTFHFAYDFDQHRLNIQRYLR